MLPQVRLSDDNGATSMSKEPSSVTASSYKSELQVEIVQDNALMTDRTKSDRMFSPSQLVNIDQRILNKNAIVRKPKIAIEKQSMILVAKQHLDLKEE